MDKINGKEIATQIVAELKKKDVSKKFLAVFLVGNDPSSISFVKQKEKIAKEIGVDFRIYRPDANLNNDKLRDYIRKIVSAKKCGGVIIQLPLPSHINANYILNVIPFQKDIEVMSERMIGAFYDGRSKVLPPSVEVVKQILNKLDIKKENLRRVVVVGQGFLIGRPVTNWFLGDISEALALDKGSDFKLLKEADLVVCGTGQAGLIKSSMLKEDAIVIDFGYGISEKTNKMTGDFEVFKEDNKNIAYTPTPGGTGPVLIASLFKNFFKLNEE